MDGLSPPVGCALGVAGPRRRRRRATGLRFEPVDSAAAAAAMAAGLPPPLSMPLPSPLSSPLPLPSPLSSPLPLPSSSTTARLEAFFSSRWRSPARPCREGPAEAAAAFEGSGSFGLGGCTIQKGSFGSSPRALRPPPPPPSESSSEEAAPIVSLYVTASLPRSRSPRSAGCFLGAARLRRAAPPTISPI